MATPHVSGVAALIWSYRPTWSNAQIRDALQKTAKDLGDPGRDDHYGYGLVQAKAALDYLTAHPISLATRGRKARGNGYVDLSWGGATSSLVDVFRNGAPLASTANDGAYTDGPLGKGGGTYTYKVCEQGSSVCSNESTVTF